MTALYPETSARDPPEERSTAPKARTVQRVRELRIDSRLDRGDDLPRLKRAHNLELAHLGILCHLGDRGPPPPCSVDGPRDQSWRSHVVGELVSNLETATLSDEGVTAACSYSVRNRLCAEGRIKQGCSVAKTQPVS